MRTAFVLLQLTGTPAQASSPPDPLDALDLAWQVPAACSDVIAVRKAVAAYLDPQARVRPLAATAVIHEDPPHWVLQLTLGEDTRTLRAASCEELSQAAAVILSLALAPLDEDVPIPSAPPPEEPNARPASAPPLPVPRGWGALPGWLVRAEVGIGVGITPTLTTARLGVGIRGARYRVEAAGTFWLPADAPATVPESDRVMVTLGSAELRGCLDPKTRHLAFPTCVGVAMGALRVDEFATPRSTTHKFWSGVTLSTAVVWPFARGIALWAGPEVTLALPRPTIDLRAPSTYQSGVAAIRIAGGIELHFSSRQRARAGKKGR